MFPYITLRTDLPMFGVAGTVFGVTSEMSWLPAYFDNPAYQLHKNSKVEPAAKLDKNITSKMKLHTSWIVIRVGQCIKRDFYLDGSKEIR